ncbi:hypothetical protein P7K49_002905 [Saguinus oedipus]|uniref:Uncharacterized protein n=1 Tax=Saguinus oedipus TaxID=9490 RepID=A0ABQ9WIN2_SAGOE|nr:hypothetical protein P7K49_002905 [Saguinus oedipus]
MSTESSGHQKIFDFDIWKPTLLQKDEVTFHPTLCRDVQAPSLYSTTTKCLAGHARSWAAKKRRKKICRNENEVVQQQLSPCLSAAQLHTLQLRSTSPKPPCGIPEQHQCTDCLSVFS